MSNYVDEHLSQGETVLFRTQRHWIVYWSLASLFTLGIRPAIDRATSEFAVTSKRIIVKAGWLRQVSVEVNIDKLESISVDRTFSGRILGFGDIIVRGTGGTNERFYHVANPMEFRSAAQNVPRPRSQGAA